MAMAGANVLLAILLTYDKEPPSTLAFQGFNPHIYTQRLMDR